MSDTLISVQNVSKKFCRSLKKSLWYGMQDLGMEVLGKRHGGNGELRDEEFWAVKDVSFELKRGECLGLVGHNGAGKTTLLRVLNGLIKPDHGRVEMRGRVGALIALGAGFNPILTGRENIYVNASVLGLGKREIDDKIEEIIDFSEIGAFIEAPVQSYSSGMQVRLGFAVATALNPDILLLDEVLAVGDAAFRFKCHRRINEVLKHAAVIFVSHDMPHIARVSTKGLVLGHGKVLHNGNVGDAIEVYRDLNEGAVFTEKGFVTLQSPVTEFSIEVDDKEFQTGSRFGVNLKITSSEYAGDVTLRINVFSLAGTYVTDCVADSAKHQIYLGPGPQRWRVEIPIIPLKAGRYLISFSIANSKGEFIALSHKCHEMIITGGHQGTVADCQLPISLWKEIGV